MELVFTQIYENTIWGNNRNSSYRGSSGGGSDIEYNRTTYVPLVKEFIRQKGIKTVVDLGCGDFRCGPLLYEDLDVLYTGYDAYSKVVDYNSTQHLAPKYTFKHLDFCNKKVEVGKADLCILKDVLQHWPLKDIYTILDYFVETKQFKYILITNCCTNAIDNTDIPMGQWRSLSSTCLPLKKYEPKRLYTYDTKEVSVLEINP